MESPEKLAEAITTEIIQTKESVNCLQIIDDGAYNKAADYLKMIKLKIKQIDEQRKTFTKPLNDTIKAIKAFFDAPLAEATEIKSSLESKMLIFAKRKQKEEEEKEIARKAAEVEALKLQAQLEKSLGDERLYNEGQRHEMLASIKEHEEINVGLESAKGTYSTTSIRKSWDFVIEDESKIERFYLKPDEVKIREHIRMGERKIEGIKIFEREILVSK